MLSNERRRQHRSLLEAPRITAMIKKSTSGTLSPETTTTTSSGYSTGGSSISNTKESSLEKSSSIAYRQQCHQQQHKTQSKGLHSLLSKLKNLLLPSKTNNIRSQKMRSTTSRQISSINILRQYHPNSITYDKIPSSSIATSNAISLPFTYYHNSPIQHSSGNFEKISAWLDHTEKMANTEQNGYDSLFINSHKPKITTSSSSVQLNKHAITVVMKNTRANIRPPKRSSSLVARITQPIIEQQFQKTISPASSFSSSILTRGMSERITLPSSPTEKTDKHSSKSNRHRPVDFSRRCTIASTNEHNSNKENSSTKYQDQYPQDIYRFSPVLSKNKVEIRIPSSKPVVTKQYYFHSNSTDTNEDLLNNSYGLTLLKQQKQPTPPQPVQPRHSVGTVLMISQVPNHISSEKQYDPRTYLQQDYSLDSLDDILCDREVESYFYPTSPLDHLYMNFENSTNSSYQPSLSYFHETLC
ncbi:unnamed protein product [Rotaria magnacalcarata]|uniref:Uncharacterized protein n=1 Tax=Rotaria magnacalcarata TaxID=392030 RepID=A0A816TPK6_9BILA|nr:unnamed protein product [Rotaria magnacalcarata]CAF1657477.1 unnamed protein product [Rotaria magnacalcarata]CAF2103751.1 unnamed protein product [Rotaria magnacalcarata]CAF2122176.1 unnamed protein product [Rotaria magnacalcarata]CAF2229419.1 unnamed protein product [Rotaria magnacalcarata]